MVYGETPPRLDCDLKLGKPVPGPFWLDCIQSHKIERTKTECQIDPFPSLWWFPRMITMGLVHQLLSIPEVFHWLPTCMITYVSSPFNRIIKLPITLFEKRKWSTSNSSKSLTIIGKVHPMASLKLGECTVRVVTCGEHCDSASSPGGLICKHSYSWLYSQ